MRLQIISLMEGFPWGGSEVLWSRVAARALDQGHSLSVCFRHWPTEHSVIAGLRSRGAAITLRNYSRVSWWIRRLTFGRIDPNSWFLRQLSSFKPDVILISTGDTPDLFLDEDVYRYVTEAGCPFSLISQFYHDNTHTIEPEIRNRVVVTPVPWYRFYFVAQRNLDVFQRKLAHSLQGTSVVSNPVNLSNVQAARWPDERRLRMACVARYHCGVKGQDILLQALAHESLSGFEYTLNLFGAGPDREYLLRLIAYFGLQNRVNVCDHAADIDAVWESHHVLIMPSIAEGTPLSLQECMLKGRPAMATDVGGNDTLVVDGDTGFLVPAPTVKLFVEKLHVLFNTSLKDLQDMGVRAHEYASRVVTLDSDQKILKDLEAAVADRQSGLTTPRSSS